MNDLFINVIKSIQDFDLQKFTGSLISIVLILYVFFSFFFSFKTFSDSKKRFNDKILIIAFTVFIFIFHLFGLGYIIYSILRPKELIHDQHILKLEKYFLEYETQGIGKCKVCKFTYFPDQSYCVNCGAVVRTKCSTCENNIELDWNVCPYCGDKKKINLILNSKADLSPSNNLILSSNIKQNKINSSIITSHPKH